MKNAVFLNKSPEILHFFDNLKRGICLASFLFYYLECAILLADAAAIAATISSRNV